MHLIWPLNLNWLKCPPYIHFETQIYNNLRLLIIYFITQQEVVDYTTFLFPNESQLTLMEVPE
jgi:hypothetical protein